VNNAQLKSKFSPWKLALALVFIILGIVLLVNGDLVSQTKEQQNGFFIAVGILIACLGIVFGIALLINRRVKKDINETCVPIVDRYRESHSLSQLNDDITEWNKAPHSANASVYLIKNIVAALLDDHRYGEAKAQLDAIDSNKFYSTQKRDFEAYRDKAYEVIKNEGRIHSAAQKSKGKKKRR
jgi:predicted signal transduction protein with EAL and GGDEF domain